MNIILTPREKEIFNLLIENNTTKKKKKKKRKKGTIPFQQKPHFFAITTCLFLCVTATNSQGVGVNCSGIYL